MSFFTRGISLVALLLLVAACKHPFEIVGEGDIYSQTGTRDCLLEDYQASQPNCTENIVTGDYFETYTADPRPGWKFDGWENYCGRRVDNTCSFNFEAALVDQFAGVIAPPLKANFSAAPNPPANPNVIVIFVDDMGYADASVFGAENFTTPNIDQMASEGVMFTDFYASTPVCSGSRGGLVSGSYPDRIGIPPVLNKLSTIGLNSAETTMAETFDSMGYRTATFGKWHLGHHAPFLPNNHGFDEYYGIPYSNDMDPNIPTIHNGTIVNHNTDQSTFTSDYTNRTIDYIEDSVSLGEPFFIYLAHPMPHFPLSVSAPFNGSSGAGLYGDVMQELDWSVGEILGALDTQGVANETLVIFTSDNGPYFLSGGRATPFKGFKGTIWEGGVRVPMIAHWPGVLDAGRVVDTPIMTIDLLPTLAELIGAPLPALEIDGKSVWQLMTGESFTSPHPAYYFYYGDNGGKLQAMRSGNWKMMFAHSGSLFQVPNPTLKLYDLEADPGETTDLSVLYPDVVVDLNLLAGTMRAQLGDAEQGIPCTECRAPGSLP
jgi:arylsulfatase A-like enzyme